MSLARTALRLAAIEALNSDPVLDALCEGRVYDSRIADFDHREVVPVIILTTEEGHGEAWSKNNGGAPFNAACDLVLEIAMNVVALDEAGDPILRDGAPMIASPGTDRELEAVLDLIEERAIDVLTVGETDAARLLREAVTRRVLTVKAARFATDQTGEKLAIRLLTLRVELKGEDQRDIRDLPSGPYGLLPEPLRSVANALPEGSGRTTCDLLARYLAPAEEAPPALFRGGSFVYAPQPLDGGTAPDRTADSNAGRTFADALDIPEASS
ncbi:hypothetical protein [Methylobacterium sp. A54F]